uniref:Small ribosomal subunit protein bS18c n=1 Tax=Boodleopsis sp. H.0758 TaxID=2320802 RepID=A0A386AZT4_9CHLO|nr:ribosomal protein S18 [Boodleopsis sp. H.0758]AYC64955.1 ribosomal protein S18 [Boodleopsis sp. H.0758]
MKNKFLKKKNFDFELYSKNISNNHINYKNIKLLYNYINISGRIIPKRLNKLKTKQQRYLSKSIKNARIMGFLPFVKLLDY